MAYGFNDDKTKSPLFSSVKITPNAGEKYGDFAVRVWNAINNIPNDKIYKIKVANMGVNENGVQQLAPSTPLKNDGSELADVVYLRSPAYLTFAEYGAQFIMIIAKNRNDIPEYRDVYYMTIVGGTSWQYQSEGLNRETVVPLGSV